jgi:hypothetical protein
VPAQLACPFISCCFATAFPITLPWLLSLFNLQQQLLSRFDQVVLLQLLTGRLSLPSMTFCGSKLKLLTTSTGAKPSPARPGGSGRTNCRQQSALHQQLN